MPQFSNERQELILQWLHEQQTLTIDDLAERLQVSGMTVHRDLNELARAGLVEKMHGGVTLVGRTTRTQASGYTCGMCEMQVSARTTFVIQSGSEQHHACCPHCGFLILANLDPASSVLVRDFIYGRMVNALQATFLLESDITLCCMPSTLAFASPSDAQRFQSGFNGWLANFAEAREFLLQNHHINPE